ncbi:hypothetical protein F4811DRAFT_571066 [Daldinia bambusicola]|nr:hypothetical protein F4811DRAFT_571066 [Daldinia bambusicola]
MSKQEDEKDEKDHKAEELPPTRGATVKNTLAPVPLSLLLAPFARNFSPPLPSPPLLPDRRSPPPRTTTTAAATSMATTTAAITTTTTIIATTTTATAEATATTLPMSPTSPTSPASPAATASTLSTATTATPPSDMLECPCPCHENTAAHEGRPWVGFSNPGYVVCPVCWVEAYTRAHGGDQRFGYECEMYLRGRGKDPKVPPSKQC